MPQIQLTPALAIILDKNAEDTTLWGLVYLNLIYLLSNYITSLPGQW